MAIVPSITYGRIKVQFLLSPISLKKENKTMNEILLRRKNKVILEKGNVQNQIISTLLRL